MKKFGSAFVILMLCALSLSGYKGSSEAVPGPGMGRGPAQPAAGVESDISLGRLPQQPHTVPWHDAVKKGKGHWKQAKMNVKCKSAMAHVDVSECKQKETKAERMCCKCHLKMAACRQHDGLDQKMHNKCKKKGCNMSPRVVPGSRVAR